MSAPMQVIDSHCHLYDTRGADRADVIAQARAAGVVAMVNVGCDAETTAACIEIARTDPLLFATAGLHPHDAIDGVESIEPFLDDPEVIAVGEAGLDYHYDNSPRNVQRTAFAAQIALAHRYGLPLVIHTRDAWADTFDILRAEGVPERTVFHCFTGGPAELRTCVDLGAYVSFSGIVTFPSATELHEAAVACPLDRLLVETDSPYLAPVPHRGRPNQPAYVVEVVRRIADLRGVAAEDVAASSVAATRSVFPRLAAAVDRHSAPRST